MQNVLVVDDNPMDLRVAGACVQQCGMNAVYAINGQEALDKVVDQVPDIVLTDLDMPEINGLELVRRLRSRAPSVPVILMTAKGSEDIAAEALKLGASSYVPKRNLNNELDKALRIVSDAARARDRRQNVYQNLVSNHLQFVIGNDDEAASSIVSHLQDVLISMNLCSEGQLLAVGTALLEALSHAIDRGNLELAPESTGGDSQSDYRALRQQRLTEPPYKDRKIIIAATMTQSEAVFTIRDQGPGFDVSTIPNPDDTDNLMQDADRGLLLMQMFMDEVTFNESGNEVTLRLYADDEDDAEEDVDAE